MQTKRYVASTLVAASLSSIAGFAFAGGPPRFANPVANATDPGVITRCERQDVLNSNADADARSNWAVNCSLIGSQWLDSFKYKVVNGQPVERPAHLYPIFAYDRPAQNYPTWVPNHAACTTPTDITWYGVCRSGCYTPEQRVRFGTGYTPIVEAFDAKKQDLVTLSPDASLDKLRFIVNKVGAYTVDRRAWEQPITTFETAGGGKIRVTPEHPLLTPDGVLRTADTLKVGDSLLREDGQAVRISSSKTEKVLTKVYNVQPDGDDLTSNVLVAEGFLTGSARYQSDDVKYIGRRVVRESLRDQVIARK